MEPHSQPELSNSKSILEGQLRECFGRVVYSHKTHEKCADLLLERQSCIKLTQIVLSAMSTCGFIAAILGETQYAAIIGVVVSTILLVINAYTKDYDMGELAQKHKQAASEIWLIREKYLSLLTDLRAGEVSEEEIRLVRDQLLTELHDAYSGSPSTTFKAYKKAQKALQVSEDMTFSEEELDAFLPSELHRSALQS